MDRCFAAFIVTNPQIESVDFDHLRLQKNPPRRGYRSFHHRVPVQPEQPHPPSHCQRPPLKNREVEREPGLPSHREGRASNRTRQSAGRHRRPPSPSPKEILEESPNLAEWLVCTSGSTRLATVRPSVGWCRRV